MRLRLILAIGLLAWSGGALAQAPAPARTAAPAPAGREPVIAPVPDWVEPLPVATPNPALGDRPAQILLSSTQSRYSAERAEHFIDIAFLVQNQQGLQGLGTIVLPWQPDQAELIVHKVRIVRGGTVIDLLANGQRFTVLRRENNLESAMLDGMLTAVMQAEGLAVGDVLNVSFSMRRRGGTLPLRGENYFFAVHGQPIRHQYIRQIWPASLPIHWRATGLFEGARTRDTRLGTELIADLTDVEGPETPANLPTRYLFASALQLSQYRDWAEISALVAPHYEQAATPAPDSPLRAEIARIAAASADPRVRTMAALRLVQDQVRYFALVMGDGNYLPSTADQSWSRRFADCKGKVVLLVALLRGLGIEAEPVLVHSRFGDALNERLPMMSGFDHVIVRVRLDGRSYWLDGTRGGDRNLDDLASSNLSWGLPIRAAGATLERIPHAPPALPLMESEITYDGTNGLGGSVPVRIVQTFRGDGAVQMRAALSQVGREVFLRQMRASMAELPGEDAEIEDVRLEEDDATGALSVVVTARGRMTWTTAPGSVARHHRFENETITWQMSADRPDGPLRDAPYAFGIPVYRASTESVILPNGGRDFAIEGESFDRTIAGTRISLRLSLADGRAVARSEFRRIEREVGAETVRASTDAVAQINNARASIRAVTATALGGPAGAPPPSVVRRADAPPEITRAPVTAQDFNSRGHRHLLRGTLDAAEADFVQASTLNPNWSRPIANRAIVMLQRGRVDEAEPLLTQAASRDANDFVVHQGLGGVHLARNQPIQAVVAFSRSLDLDPDNAFTLNQRALAYLQLGAFDEAIADFDAILARQPSNLGALGGKMRAHVWRGEADLAVAAADAMLATDPRDPALIYARAGALLRVGRPADAAAGYRDALTALAARTDMPEARVRSLRRRIYAEMGDIARAVAEIGAELERNPGDASLLNARCWTRATANFELPQALVDCEQAVAAAPRNASILDSRAFVKLRLGQIDAAIADADAALLIDPQLAGSLYVRGVARIRKGEREAGERDLAAARRLIFDIDATYRRYGVTPDAR